MKKVREGLIKVSSGWRLYLEVKNEESRRKGDALERRSVDGQQLQNNRGKVRSRRLRGLVKREYCLQSNSQVDVVSHF